jgi:hypothetical protein
MSSEPPLRPLWEIEPATQRTRDASDLEAWHQKWNEMTPRDAQHLAQQKKVEVQDTLAISAAERELFRRHAASVARQLKDDTTYQHASVSAWKQVITDVLQPCATHWRIALQIPEDKEEYVATFVQVEFRRQMNNLKLIDRNKAQSQQRYGRPESPAQHQVFNGTILPKLEPAPEETNGSPVVNRTPVDAHQIPPPIPLRQIAPTPAVTEVVARSNSPSNDASTTYRSPIRLQRRLSEVQRASLLEHQNSPLASPRPANRSTPVPETTSQIPEHCYNRRSAIRESSHFKDEQTLKRQTPSIVRQDERAVSPKHKTPPTSAPVSLSRTPSGTPLYPMSGNTTRVGLIFTYRTQNNHSAQLNKRHALLERFCPANTQVSAQNMDLSLISEYILRKTGIRDARISITLPVSISEDPVDILITDNDDLRDTSAMVIESGLSKRQPVTIIDISVRERPKLSPPQQIKAFSAINEVNVQQPSNKKRRTESSSGWES